MKKLAVTVWLTLLCFFLLGNVHAWEVPTYLRVNSGTRMWFTFLGGDAVQKDHTKVDLIENLGIKRDKLVWEYFMSFRVENIHVIRLRAEPFSNYDQSEGGSYQKIGTGSLGYDLDFYMTPQLLFGTNVDFDFPTVRTRVTRWRASWPSACTTLTPARPSAARFSAARSKCSFRARPGRRSRRDRTHGPRAAAPRRRLEMLQALAESGVPVGVLTAPVIPALNDSDLEAILESASGAGARWAGTGAGALRCRSGRRRAQAGHLGVPGAPLTVPSVITLATKVRF